jgi:hypothetical protein
MNTSISTQSLSGIETPLLAIVVAQGAAADLQRLAEEPLGLAEPPEAAEDLAEGDAE